jgi:hypothetical protein
MYLKILIIGILLTTVGTSCAWTDETPPVANETLNVGLSPYLNSSTATSSYLYGLDSVIMNIPLCMQSYLSNDAITVCTQYYIYKQVWTGTSYTQIDNCNISMETCVDLVYNPQADAYELPTNWAQTTSNGFLVKKYFQGLINSDSQYCSEWNNTDESDHPDVFYSTVDIDVEDGNNYWGYAYISIDNDDEETLKKGEIDYGFALDGRGSDGASGSIYEGVNMYGGTGGDASGMGASFNVIFWVIIPLIFVLAAVKFMSRVM